MIPLVHIHWPLPHFQAIVSICTQWQKIGSEILFHYLYVSHATKAVALCVTLAMSSSGWQTKRIHIASYIYPGSNNPSAAHIDIETNALPTEEIADPGSAPDSQLRLPYLQQILLCSYMRTLLKQLGRSDLPSLHILRLEDGTSINYLPDVEEFLRQHSLSLVLLDLNTYVNVPLILDLS